MLLRITETVSGSSCYYQTAHRVPNLTNHESLSQEVGHQMPSKCRMGHLILYSLRPQFSLVNSSLKMDILKLPSSQRKLERLMEKES